MRNTRGKGRETRTRNISLQPELDDYVNSLVESGDFANYSEVVRTALREMKQREKERAEFLQAQKGFMESLEQGAKGKFVDSFIPKS